MKGLRHIAELLPAIIKPGMKPLTPIQERLSLAFTGQEEIVFQHSVMCQTCMPYRNPGDVREWDRRNGLVHMRIKAGEVLDPARNAWVKVGLPFGPKPRLVLYHLNAEAMRTQSPSIELEDSLTAFVKRTLGLDPGGRNIRTVKQQLSRLAGADFRFGLTDGVRAITIKGTVISGFELWTPRDPRQKTLWPTTVRFSSEYFESLMEHAVPLNEGAVARLSHSAMALDVYTWLAQRLHRVDPRKKAFVPWACLKEQFGQGYERMNDFRRVFLRTLLQIREVYRDAKYSFDEHGLTLYNSRPPVLRRDLLR